MTHLTRDLKILRSLWYIIILTLSDRLPESLINFQITKFPSLPSKVIYFN